MTTDYRLNMKVTPLAIPDVLLIKLKVFGDDRGFFMETFQAERYRELVGIDLPFVQDNFSRSQRGVLRGLHFQKSKPQGKLITVTRGTVFDVAVDIRRNSATFGKWVGIELSEENHYQLWIPPGFAHGFIVLSEVCDFTYKCTALYDPKDEVCIHWQDADLNINWPSVDPIVSDKDRKGRPFKEILSDGLR